MSAARFGRPLAALLLLAALGLAALVVTPAVVQAQPAPLDPRAIALTPDDLPPGFAFVPEETKLETLSGGYAVQLTTQLNREPSMDNLLSGPVSVGQIIIRVDRLIVPGDLLTEVRAQLLAQQGFSLVPGAPNDGGTASLQKNEGEAVVYAVGFVKNEMVVFTIWAGLPEVVDLQGLLTLAGISSAKYDAAVQQ